MKPKIFLTRELPPKAMERLKQYTDLEMNTEDRVLSKEEIIKGVKGKDALLCLLTDAIDGDIMDANPELKIIANYAVGFNNIDVEAATQRHIPVSNTPGVLTETSADLAFSLMTALARRLPEADSFVRTGEWKGWGPLQYVGTDIYGATLGIVGLGRIGKAVAKRAKGFDMKLIYWNRTRLEESEEKALGLEYFPFEQVLAQADFISLNIAYNESTHHLIGEKQLGLMKKEAYLINTARGPVVDEGALVEALREEKIQGAGLDVYEHEPAVHPELLNMKNTVLLPHIASASIATRTKMGMIAIDNLLAACNGEKIPNLVNKELVNDGHAH